MDRLYDIEIAALQRIAAEYPEAEQGLASMFRSCRVTKRENTGNGFFTNLVLDAERFSPVQMVSPLSEAWFGIAGMLHGIGCLVFLRGGYPNLLEGYSLAGEDTSKIDFASVHFTRGDGPED